MTNTDILTLAKTAAQAAFDAHGADLPPAETAYEFIRQMAYEEAEGSDAEAQAAWDGMELSAQDWLLFRVAYLSTYRELASAGSID